MHMTGRILSIFEDFIKLGNVSEDRGDFYFRQKYYSDAEAWYLKAYLEYEKAYYYAEKFVDCSRKQETYSKMKTVEGKRQNAISENNIQRCGL